MKNTQMENVVFTAIDIDSLIEKIAKKVLLIIETSIENHNQQTEYKDLLNTPLTSLDISIRAFNVCRNADIKTLGQLASIKRAELVKMRNCGRHSIIELENLLNKYHLTFGMNLYKYGIK
jgi:DNA-directed RNA polymerase alpha subunit